MLHDAEITIVLKAILINNRTIFNSKVYNCVENYFNIIIQLNYG